MKNCLSCLMAVLLAVPSYAADRASIGEGKARQIACAAIQLKYPDKERHCANLGVTRDNEGWHVFDKCSPVTKLCGGASAVVSPKTGKIIKIGYWAM